jgi:hypothetical protein
LSDGFFLAIYGVGSNWDGEEIKNTFFSQGRFILGWNEDNAQDLYALVSLLKIGDILYIKANQPGSHTIRVKGIGIVTRSFLNCIPDFGPGEIADWQSIFVGVD